MEYSDEFLAFGLAEVKVEGQMTIKDSMGDSHTLPELPPAFITTSVRIGEDVFTRKEYNEKLIKQQPYF